MAPTNRLIEARRAELRAEAQTEKQRVIRAEGGKPADAAASAKRRPTKARSGPRGKS